MERNWAHAAKQLDSLRLEAPATAEVRDVVALLDLFINLRRGRLEEAERTLRGRTLAPAPARTWFAGVLAAELHARRGRLDSAAVTLSRTLDDVDRWRASLDDRALRQTLLEPRLLYADPDLGFATVIASLAESGRAGEAWTLVERYRARELLDRLERSAGLGDRELPRTVPVARPQPPPRSKRVFVSGDAAGAAGPVDQTTAFVEYLTGSGGEPTTVFVRTRDAVRSHSLASIDSVRATVALFGRLAAAGAPSPSLARSLGKQLLDKVVATLPPQVTRVVLVLAPGLHDVPFDALRLSMGGCLANASSSAAFRLRRWVVFWRGAPPAGPAFCSASAIRWRRRRRCCGRIRPLPPTGVRECPGSPLQNVRSVISRGSSWARWSM
jgi:hypothetical protein